MTRSTRFLTGGVALALTVAVALGAPRRAAPSPLISTDATAGDEPTSPELEGPVEEPVEPPDPTAIWREPFFPFMDDEAPDASVSIGDTTHGWVVNAKRITESDACAILPKQRERDLGYGTSDLIDLIEHAAAELHARTGTRLWVGNIGRRGGGDIAWSVSHNSGRDADIALSYLDASGHAVDPPDLVPLDHDGLAKVGGYRFDVARTWITVKALLSQPGTDVQYVFVSEPLKKKLLVHARQLREPAALLQRFDDVVHQPAGSLPHNDHLHLRIYCGERDIAGGCVNFGLVHSWVHLHDDARERRVGIAVEKLGATDAEQRRRAIDRLALLGSRAHADAIAGGLEDEVEVVREASARALGSMGEVRHGTALTARFAREHDAGAKVAILGALSALGGAPAGELLANVIATAPPECASPVSSEPPELAFTPLSPAFSGTAPPSGLELFCLGDEIEGRAADVAALRLAAIDAAGQSDRLEPVEPLLALLSHPDPQLRARAAGALARITNRSFGERWDDESQSAAERDEAIASWRRWVGLLRRYNRDAWVASGFAASNYRVPSIDKKHVWELVRAVARGDHLAYNAHRALMRISDHRPSGLSWTDSSACGYWLRWFVGHRRPFELDAPPEPTVRACR